MLERDHFQDVNVNVRKLSKLTFQRKCVRFCIVLSHLILVSANALAKWLL